MGLAVHLLEGWPGMTHSFKLFILQPLSKQWGWGRGGTAGEGGGRGGRVLNLDASEFGRLEL